jgi:hypothetical protein
MKNITPWHLRCGPLNCPAVFELEDGRAVIVGEFAHMHPPGTAPGDLYEALCNENKIGDNEAAIIIDRALLSTIRDEVREECAKLLRDFAAERAERGETGPVAIRDEALSASATASLLAARIDALRETPHE